jgi:hypothetical protein
MAFMVGFSEIFYADGHENLTADVMDGRSGDLVIERDRVIGETSQSNLRPRLISVHLRKLRRVLLPSAPPLPPFLRIQRFCCF